MEDIEAMFVVLDFGKAFDNLNWDFIDKILRKFTLGDSILKWIKTFYVDANSCVMNNGWFSDRFKIEKGVRQGCPLSPYIYILSVELLAISIRQERNIKGVKIKGEEKKNHNMRMILD